MNEPLLHRSDALPAIRAVLAQYRSTDGHITEDMITAAWGEYDRISARNSGGEIGTVLGILCNVRDALLYAAENSEEYENLEPGNEARELQRAVDVLKPLVFPEAGS